MRNAHSLSAKVAAHRPPGAPAREAKAIGEIAQRWRDELARVLTEIDAEALTLNADEVGELAVAMSELAEDLHTDSGLWRGLEAGNRTLFGTPLPLLWRTGDPPLTPFDARRFQFFLHSVWRHFKPDCIVSPRHRGFVAVASRAEAFFSEAFAGRLRASSVAAFLGTANARGWEVKRKLVWLGTNGFLFRFAHAAIWRATRRKTRTLSVRPTTFCVRNAPRGPASARSIFWPQCSICQERTARRCGAGTSAMRPFTGSTHCTPGAWKSKRCPW